MSAEENKALIRRYLEAVNGKPKTPELLERFVDDEELKKHIAASEEAFPLYRIDPEEMIAEGDLVSVRGVAHGVHRGPFQGLPPTWKTLAIPLFITYRVVRNRIVEHWMLVDSLAMMQQLGLAPAPATVR